MAKINKEWQITRWKTRRQTRHKHISAEIAYTSPSLILIPIRPVPGDPRPLRGALRPSNQVDLYFQDQEEKPTDSFRPPIHTILRRKNP